MIKNYTLKMLSVVALFFSIAISPEVIAKHESPSLTYSASQIIRWVGNDTNIAAYFASGNLEIRSVAAPQIGFSRRLISDELYNIQMLTVPSNESQIAVVQFVSGRFKLRLIPVDTKKAFIEVVLKSGLVNSLGISPVGKLFFYQEVQTGKINAIDVATGKEIWQADVLDEEEKREPLILRPMVGVITDGSGTIKITPKSIMACSPEKKELWQLPSMVGGEWSIPLPEVLSAEKQILVVSDEKRGIIYGILKNLGTVIWQKRFTDVGQLVAISNDCSRQAAILGGQLVFYNWPQEGIVQSIHIDNQQDCLFSPNGQMLFILPKIIANGKQTPEAAVSNTVEAKRASNTVRVINTTNGKAITEIDMQPIEDK